jgi:hypothetical protein
MIIHTPRPFFSAIDTPLCPRFMLNTGTFLRTQLLNIDTYGERRGYPPAKIGYPIVKVRNGIIQDAVEVEI